MKFFASIFKLLKLILLIGIILGAVLAYRAYYFTIDNKPVDKTTAIALNYQQAAKRFAGALKFKTVSPQNPSDRDVQQFVDFQQYVATNYPLVHQKLNLTKINELSLLYLWKSKSSTKKPALIMAHYDVVPVDPATIDDWTFPPFGGVIAQGKIWGRGSLDDKSAVLAIFESVEFLLSEGFEPNRDIYFAFGHDEEIGGLQGAKKIAEYLKNKKIELEYVLDEGGSVAEGLVPGITTPIGFIGVAEKGYVTVKLSVQTDGGHSSVPPPQTSVGIISQAIVNLENNPFEPKLVNATEEMLLGIGKNMSFSKRLVFANLWLFEPFLLDQLAQSQITNANIRTTMAATVFNAGDKENALPINASALVNLRLLPGDSIDFVLSHIKQSINDDRVKVEMLIGGEASPVSDLNSGFYHQLVKVIDEVSPEQNIFVVPNLMVAGTDSKHYQTISENVYRFNGVKIDPDSLTGFHGTDEYLSVKEFQRAINFYYQLIKLNK